MTSAVPGKGDPDAAPKISDPWPFDLLPEAERSPWLDKAEAELREGFGAPLWAKTKERARAPLRERRAVSLYLAAKGGGKKDSG